MQYAKPISYEVVRQPVLTQKLCGLPNPQSGITVLLLWVSDLRGVAAILNVSSFSLNDMVC